MKRAWKRIALAMALFLFAVVFFGWNLYRNRVPAGAVREGEVPIGRLAADVPDATKAGDPDAAMRQLQQLMDALRANNWDPMRVPASLRRLSDAKFSESSDERSTGEAVAFPTQPSAPQDGNAPEYERIAFYTGVYARFNRSYYQGDRSQSHPSGYYIVGWKDGRIEKVPTMKVRVFTSRNRRAGAQLLCFPGMAEYDTAEADPMLRDAASK